MGGYRIHFLEPVTTAFQAEVELGSLWKELPDLSDPCKFQKHMSIKEDLKLDTL